MEQGLELIVTFAANTGFFHVGWKFSKMKLQ